MEQIEPLGLYIMRRRSGLLSTWRTSRETSRDRTLKNRRTMQNPIDRLHKAIEAIDADATRVELWAAILGGWAKPVPGYEPDDKFRLPHPRNQAAKTASTGRRPEPRQGPRHPLKFN